MREYVDQKLQKYVKETVVNANRFICVSDGLKKAVEKICGSNANIDVVTNMINPCFTYYEMPQLCKFTFFSMGSLIERKGFDLLIQAFAEEFCGNDNVTLRIAGSGNEYSDLKGLIEKHNASNSISLIGQLSRENTLEEYINCNCFVLASRAETYGLVYREAMAVGRPIISTKHGGFSEDEWSDEYGFLIDIDDLESLKKSMRNVYENYKKYDLRRISQICLEECASDSVARKIETVLLDVRNNQIK